MFSEIKFATTMRVALVAGIVPSILAQSAWAYLVPALPYQELFARSDLVVIARPIASRDTNERMVMRGVNPSVPVIGVTTEFQAMFVFKGGKRQRFKFHHFREQASPKRNVVVMAALPASRSTYR